MLLLSIAVLIPLLLLLVGPENVLFDEKDLQEMEEQTRLEMQQYLNDRGGDYEESDGLSLLLRRDPPNTITTASTTTTTTTSSCCGIDDDNGDVHDDDDDEKQSSTRAREKWSAEEQFMMSQFQHFLAVADMELEKERVEQKGKKYL